MKKGVNDDEEAVLAPELQKKQTKGDRRCSSLFVFDAFVCF